MINPWLNISLCDTVAECDKRVIHSLCDADRDKLMLDGLPEPYHGNPESKVYILEGFPSADANNLCHSTNISPLTANYVLPNGQRFFANEYERSVCEELWHVNRSFLWLRKSRDVSFNGYEYSGYDWWEKRVAELRKAFESATGRNLEDSIFAVTLFPYQVKDEKIMDKLRILPSMAYTDEFVYEAMKSGKLIVLMGYAKKWYDRIAGLIGYKNKIVLKNPQCLYITPGNMQPNEWQQLLNNL